MHNKTFISDFFHLLFAPKTFFAERFLDLSSQRIALLGGVGTFFGLLVGSLLQYYFASFVMSDFLVDKQQYLTAITGFGLNEEGFLLLLRAQKAHGLLIAALSPIIAYIAPHIFGGALFAFLWMLFRTENAVSFTRVLECSSVALTSLAWYAVPAIGPIIAVIMVGVNSSRALFVNYKLAGFMKVMAIISAIYLCFFLGSASLGLLASSLSTTLN